MNPFQAYAPFWCRPLPLAHPLQTYPLVSPVLNNTDTHVWWMAKFFVEWLTDRPSERAIEPWWAANIQCLSDCCCVSGGRGERDWRAPDQWLTSWYVRMQQQEKLMIQILNRMHWVHANSLTLIQPQHYPCLITCHVALLLIFLTQLFWSNSPLFLLNCVCVRFNSTLRLGDICRLNPREH